MSKTIRRKSGDQEFAYSCRDEWDNNPYWGRSNRDFKYVTKTFLKQDWYRSWCPFDQEYYYKERMVTEKVRVYFSVDNPRDHYEMLETKQHSVDWERKMRRDGVSSTSQNQRLKEDANMQHRSDTKKELARLAKMANYEDMDFVDSKRKSDRWNFF